MSSEATQPLQKRPGDDSCRILLIEDNADGRQTLRNLLVLWGHEVQVAGDGVQGLETIRKWRPDVAVIDIGLPGLDGYQVAQVVRTVPGGNEVFLIALTGYGQPEDRERALTAGFDAHLVKPPDLDELSRLLSGLTRGHVQSPTD